MIYHFIAKVVNRWVIYAKCAPPIQQDVWADEATSSYQSIVQWQLPYKVSRGGRTIVDVTHQYGVLHVRQQIKESYDLIILLLVVVGIKRSPGRGAICKRKVK